MTCGILIALPHGFNASGVTLWGARLAGAFAAAGRPAGLIVHPTPPDQRALEVPLHPGVRVFGVGGVPALEAAAGDLAPFIPAYRDAARALSRDGPVALCPNLHGDCFGLAAAISQVEPEALRVVAWQHTDHAYDLRLMAHYEPVISRFVAISGRIEELLRQALPGRGADVVRLPHGVDVPAEPPRRAPLAGRAMRLVYTGRVEHAQKRIGALVAMSDELTRRGLDHELTLVGDGPALAEVSVLAATRPNLRVAGSVPPASVAAELDRADAFVLASRYEGLSVSMLEAMARGCVPVVTRVRSGAADAVDHGASGLLVDVAPDADGPAAARALAEAVCAVPTARWAVMSRAAWETARDRFSAGAHARGAAAVCDAAAAGPARAWPASRPCAFAAAAGAGGSVPAEGPARLGAVLGRLAGRTIVVHGTGRHTLQLGEAFARAPARIAAFADDDPRVCGTRLWNWPVIAPEAARRAGATDVVISSWINEAAIWERRAVYERQGLAVHRVYAAE